MKETKYDAIGKLLLVGSALAFTGTLLWTVHKLSKQVENSKKNQKLQVASCECTKTDSTIEMSPRYVSPVENADNFSTFGGRESKEQEVDEEGPQVYFCTLVTNDFQMFSVYLGEGTAESAQLESYAYRGTFPLEDFSERGEEESKTEIEEYLEFKELEQQDAERRAREYAQVVLSNMISSLGFV